MKLHYVLFVVLGVALLFGCASKSVNETGGTMPKAPSAAAVVEEPPPAAATEAAPEPPPETGPAPADDAVVMVEVPPEPVRPVERFSVQADDYTFTPSTITVKKGSKVVLSVTAVDRTYGFAIMAFGVNQEIPAKETAEITFVADEAGTFEIKNTRITSGAAYGMKGSLVVEE
ncbi:MAG: cupredoxin domain-containing protein [Candidatus Micrarchaeota archaeon]